MLLQLHATSSSSSVVVSASRRSSRPSCCFGNNSSSSSGNKRPRACTGVRDLLKRALDQHRRANENAGRKWNDLVHKRSPRLTEINLMLKSLSEKESQYFKETIRSVAWREMQDDDDVNNKDDKDDDDGLDLFANEDGLWY